MNVSNEMDLTKEDNQMAKGLAIIGMVLLHLFCRLGELPYEPMLHIGETPFVYFIGLFGDLCVPVFCFCSGYAHYLLKEKKKEKYTYVIRDKIIALLKNYWCILILFSILGFLLDGKGLIPGNINNFLGNLFLYKLSYNGAWWFLLTYIILIIISPVIVKIVKRFKWIHVAFVSGILYFIFYIFRFIYVFSFESELFSWIWQQLVLLGTSQFAYVIGMIFRKTEVMTKLKSLLADKDIMRKAIVFFVPIILFLIHCVEQSLIIAPITGLGTIVCFFLWNKPQSIKRVFMFMGEHSTNIWLIHMFFYATLFVDFVFVVKYPICIFGMMMGLCIVTSLIVQRILKNLNKFIVCLKR